MTWFFSTGGSSPLGGVLCTILGLILLLFPGMSGSVFCWALAAGALLLGATHLVSYYNARRQGFSGAGDGFVGLFFVLIGVFCLISPATVLSLLPLALGIVLLLNALGKLPAVFEAFRMGSGSFRPLLISALIPLVLGIILVANPFGAAKGVIRFFGLSLMLDGICDLSAARAGRR